MLRLDLLLKWRQKLGLKGFIQNLCNEAKERAIAVDDWELAQGWRQTRINMIRSLR